MRYFAFLDAVSGYHQVITWTRHPPTSPPSFSLVAASGISIIQKLKIIESQIPELSKAFQSQPKPFRVFQSLSESSKAFKSHPKPSRVIQSLLESSKAFQSLPKSSKFFFILFYFYIYIYLYFKPIIIYYIISLSAWWYQHMDLSAPSASTPSASMPSASMPSASMPSASMDDIGSYS